MAKKGYWVVCYESISDASVLPDYGKAARPVIEAAGGRLIFAGKPVKTYEAGVNEMAVLAEFESVEKAIAVYESDGYQQAVRILNNKVKRDFRIVEGM